MVAGAVAEPAFLLSCVSQYLPAFRRGATMTGRVTAVFLPQLARKIAEIHVDTELKKNFGILRRKANKGKLTPDEDDENRYKDFIEAVDVISIIRAKARQCLGNNPALDGDRDARVGVSS